MTATGSVAIVDHVQAEMSEAERMPSERRLPKTGGERNRAGYYH